jgi:hypothetical protein
MHNWLTYTKVITLAVMGAVLLQAAFALTEAPDGMKTSQANKASREMTKQPIACNLAGLNASQRKRQEELWRKLLGEVKSVRELPEGYEVILPDTAETILAAAEFISLERICCSFLEFDLAVCREGEPIALRLTGGDGVKEFLKSALGGKLQL